MDKIVFVFFYMVILLWIEFKYSLFLKCFYQFSFGSLVQNPVDKLSWVQRIHFYHLKDAEIPVNKRMIENCPKFVKRQSLSFQLIYYRYVYMHMRVCGLDRRHHDLKTAYYLVFQLKLCCQYNLWPWNFLNNPVSVLNSKLLTVVFLYPFL